MLLDEVGGGGAVQQAVVFDAIDADGHGVLLIGECSWEDSSSSVH
jgi:hypothetical protein